MLSDLNRAAVDGQVDETQLDALWQRIQQYLEVEKEWILQEISHYRPPIPACDSQFNGLLEDRATIVKDLGRVSGMRKQGLSPKQQIEWLDEFLQSSQHFDGELVESLRQSLATLRT